MFIHVFGFLESEVAAKKNAGDQRTRALLGCQGELTFARLHALMSPVIPNWSFLRSADGFVGEIDQSRPMSYKFRLKAVLDFDHTACPKCTGHHDIVGECVLYGRLLNVDILTGKAPTKCSEVMQVHKVVSPVFSLHFVCRRRNGTAFSASLQSGGGP